MPKQKPVEKSVAEPAASADVKKRSKTAAPTVKTPAATHKRASKKTTAVGLPAEVVAVTPVASVVPSRRPSHDEIATLAYLYWERRGHQGGSPEEDWFQAERELSELAKNR